LQGHALTLLIIISLYGHTIWESPMPRSSVQECKQFVRENKILVGQYAEGDKQLFYCIDVGKGYTPVVNRYVPPQSAGDWPPPPTAYPPVLYFH